MFDATLDTRIRAVNPAIITDANDNPRRVTNLDLQFEFSDDIAAGLGEVGRDALKHLKSGAQKSAVILLDAVQCSASFEAGKEKHSIKKMAGVRAAAGKPNKEDALPTVKLTLSFATRHEDLCWLVDHLDETLKVKITRSQLELKTE